MKPTKKVAETQHPPPLTLRLAGVARHLCVSRSMAYIVIADPSFPKPKAIGLRITWREVREHRQAVRDSQVLAYGAWLWRHGAGLNDFR